MPSAGISAFARDPAARVAVFVDGQNLFHACRTNFGHSLCHPDLLARHLAGTRDAGHVAVRYYTGRPSPDVAGETERVARLDRRLAGMRERGVVVRTRRLDYHWAWGPTTRVPAPSATALPRTVVVRPYLRAQEKGIDLLLGLEVVELAVAGAFDIGIVVSRDRDLCEIPGSIRRLRERLPAPVRLEAAVAVPRGTRAPITIPGFDYTHQIDAAVFAAVRDDTDYSRPRRHRSG